ncbi:SIR2 family NAD-dependent protein deacylase [Levilactobacillus mulengensis]|uniref:SIR2 family NAD-dependent protein deacylase n=1 Tax=Levilactobacillus mulengensis TaxID=2486025 RepID=UPI0013DE0BE8|nr:SIR2 family protein [Levilactobacillus mulengensis]
MSILEQLAEYMSAKKIIPFLGAGSSIRIAPDWNHLTALMKTALSKSTESDDNLAIAQEYEDEFGRAELCHFLQKYLEISSFDDELGEVPLTFLGGAFPVIYTTNFDNMIESMMTKYKRPLQVIYTQQDALKADNLHQQLIKFHGDYTHPDELVFTKKDYEARMDKGSPLDIILKSHLMTNYLLFIGYSMSDPDLHKLIDELRPIIGTNSLPAFLIAYNSSEQLKSMCEDNGITLIAPKEFYPVDDNATAFSKLMVKLSDMALSANIKREEHDTFNTKSISKVATIREIEALSHNMLTESIEQIFDEFRQLYSGFTIIPQDAYILVSNQMTEIYKRSNTYQQINSLSNYSGIMDLIKVRKLKLKNMYDMLLAIKNLSLTGQELGNIGLVDLQSTCTCNVVLAAIVCDNIVKKEEKVPGTFWSYLSKVIKGSMPFEKLPRDLRVFARFKIKTAHLMAHTTYENPLDRQSIMQKYLSDKSYQFKKSISEADVGYLRQLVKWHGELDNG